MSVVRSAAYQTMNADGSKIFYVEHGELYVYDFETETQTRLTSDHGIGEANGSVQELVSDVSEDGSYVYFVARACWMVEVKRRQQPLPGTQHGQGWKTTYIATSIARGQADMVCRK